MTAIPRQLNHLPLSFVIPSVVFRIHFVGEEPSRTIIDGFIRRICVCRNISQTAVSSGSGTLLPGGLHFTMLVM